MPQSGLLKTLTISQMCGAGVDQLSFWDAQIWATARFNQILAAFSEDLSDDSVLEGLRFTKLFAEGFRIEDWAGWIYSCYRFTGTARGASCTSPAARPLPCIRFLMASPRVLLSLGDRRPSRSWILFRSQRGGAKSINHRL